MTSIIHSSWNPIKGFLYREPLIELNMNILPNISYQPSKENIFRVFNQDVKNVKVVILGMDPYPTPGDAIGLSFVNGTNKVPASLRIIKQELEREGYINPNIHSWEKQGVFLLNTSLTVETGKAGSHLKYWKPFTEAVIKHLSYNNPCIWLLWGKSAQHFEQYIYNPYTFNKSMLKYIKDLPIAGGFNFVMKSAHPAAEVYSGGNSGFIGNDHFYMTNEILKVKNKNLINW